MKKTHTATHQKTRHERSECSSFYGSLLFIIVLILATAVVLQKFGSDGFGKGDVTGMTQE